MGRDGLVFVNVRKDIVKLKRKDNLAEAPFKEHGAGTSTRWSHCCVTGRPLDRPVFCETGKLYNKDSVIELLLDRKKAQLNAEAEERLKQKKRSKKHKKKGKLILKGNEIPTETHRACAHIRDLGDIKELRIKINPNYREHVPYNTLALGKSNGSSSEQGFVKHVKYQCPITSAEFNGSKQFFGIWICGHTLSDPVFRELKNKKKETNVCPVCNASYSETDLIRINPIHPDHKDQSKKLFMKRRKAQDTRVKLKRKMRKEMILHKKGQLAVKNEKKSESESESDSDADSTSSESSGELDRLKAALAKKVRARLASRSRSRSNSPVVIPSGGSTPISEQVEEVRAGSSKIETAPDEIDPAEILILDSDDEHKKNERKIEECKVRQLIHERKLQEFEDIIKRKGAAKETNKRPKKRKPDPNPIEISD